ncbi:hypothetical protein FALBO_16904 [Fusarium albosuccineum]|uniref:Uncharacterized protein n=1 Tax=Fusarium albosuccineum TaxID=1237068 RepID=A0A8H4NU39_9HYPO|nr:hypothetical protein FALBO_16904 [Fusarium albosuccineum]
MPPLTFPPLHDLSLSQAPEDQGSLGRIKALWDEYASGWDEQTQFTILTNLKHVRANPSNKRGPYAHRLRGAEFNFGIWIILKCVYPLNKLESLKNQLLEMYPGINADSFVGPQVGPHVGTAVNQTVKAEKKTKTAFPQWWNSHHAGTEEDDVFEESEYPIKHEHDSTSGFGLSDHGSSQLQRAALKEISQPRQGPASSVAFSQVARSVREPAATFQNPASIDPFEFPSLRLSRVAKRKAEGDLSY